MLSKLESQEDFEQGRDVIWLTFLNDHSGCYIASKLSVEGNSWKLRNELGVYATIQMREMKTQT